VRLRSERLTEKNSKKKELVAVERAAERECQDAEQDFIREEQRKKNEDQRKGNDDQRKAIERAHEMENLSREFELQKLRAESGQVATSHSGDEGRMRAPWPKLPKFNEQKDDMDAFLERFERFALAQKWHKDIWDVHYSHAKVWTCTQACQRRKPVTTMS
jgi:hypothetical protein